MGAFPEGVGGDQNRPHLKVAHFIVEREAVCVAASRR
jgi:hypothetical protein